MRHSLGWQRHGIAALGVAVSMVFTGCASWTGRLFHRPDPIECERFRVAAQAALTAADSAGSPAAHAHATAMHEYHACVANHVAADTAKRPSSP